MNETALRIVSTDSVPTPEAALSFEDFWLIYPRHVAKKDARRAFDKLTPANQYACIVGAANWRPVWDDEAARREDFFEFMAYPATWINGERWEDELPKRGYASNGHVPVASTAEPFTKGEIPPHVKALLERMKAKR